MDRKTKRKMERRVIFENSLPSKQKNHEHEKYLKNTKSESEGVIFNLATEVSHKKDDKGLVELKFNGYNGGPVNLSDYGIPHPMYYDIEGISYSNNQQIPILHEHHVPIGHTTAITKNSESLNGIGIASYPSDSRKVVLEALDNGFPFQSSMGLRIANSKDIILLNARETRKVNNRQVVGPAYIANKSKLKEMTITMSGRDDSTNFNLLNQEAISMLLNAAPKEEVKTPPTNPLEELKNTLPPEKPVVVPPVVNNTDRMFQFALSKLMTKYPEHEEVIENGLKANHDLVTIENTIKLDNYEKGLTHAPKMKEGRKAEAGDKIFVHFALACGIQPETLEKNGYNKKVIENANSSSHWGFVETLVNVANANESHGRRFTGFSDVDIMCSNLKRINRNAVINESVIENSAFSVVDMPNLMRKVTTLQMEERWAIAPPWATTMLDEQSLNDFRKTESYRPGNGEIWPQLPKSGKIELTHFGEETRYTQELDTVAQLAVFDRQDVYNDNMGAISAMLKAMVEGALVIPDIKLGKKMLTQAAAAGKFWVDTENSRTGLALTRSNLSTAYNYVRTYNANLGGKNVVQMISDRWKLIVGPLLEEAAWDIIKQDRIVGNTTANTITGEKNYWAGRMDIETFPQMANSSLLGTGTFVDPDSWLLWPSLKQFSPYTITYLRGKKKPTIELVDIPENMLGYGVRGYWDLEINERERLTILRATA